MAPTVQQPPADPALTALLAEIRAGLGDSHARLAQWLELAKICFDRGRADERAAQANRQPHTAGV